MPAASVAVHVTGVVPAGNVVPLAGVHVAVIGFVPPVATGVPYVTVTGTPPGEGLSTLAGQLRVSRAGLGPGVTGELPQAEARNDVATTAAQRSRRRKGSMIDAKVT